MLYFLQVPDHAYCQSNTKHIDWFSCSSHLQFFASYGRKNIGAKNAILFSAVAALQNNAFEFGTKLQILISSRCFGCDSDYPCLSDLPSCPLSVPYLFSLCCLNCCGILILLLHCRVRWCPIKLNYGNYYSKHSADARFRKDWINTQGH